MSYQDTTGGMVPTLRPEDIITQEEAKRDAQVVSEVYRGRDESEGIHLAISELESRLGPVLRQSESPDVASDPRIELVPLAEELRSQNLNLANARYRLTSILERLEL